MPCYKYRFQYLRPPWCPVLKCDLPPELVEVVFGYAFQMDTLAAHQAAVALLHAQRRSLEQMIFATRRQHSMWRDCTRHKVSWEDSMHKTTQNLLRRADEFLKTAVKYLPDPVKIVYRAGHLSRGPSRASRLPRTDHARRRQLLLLITQYYPVLVLRGSLLFYYKVCKNY